jgi:pimeloyl-ACP methyl ester carboxylesterase
MASSVRLGSFPYALNQAGQQRFWYWRGWRVRYWFHPGPAPTAQVPPLVLIHGFGANLNQWRHNLLELSQVAPVYALDLLGFGDTEKAATLYGAELWAAQVGDFIQTIIGRPVALVGHSLGALVALTVAHAQADWVAQLLMITLPLPAAREDLVARWVGRLGMRVESLVSTPLLLRPLFTLVRRPSFLRRALQSVYVVSDRVDEELVTMFAVPPQDRGAARTLCYLVRSRTEPSFSPSIKTLIAELAIPALLLWGEQDRVISVLFADELKNLSSNLIIQCLPDVGHCLYDEDPETFNQIVTAWAVDRNQSG